MTNPTRRRAVIYCRISESVDFRDKVAEQEANMREYAAAHGYAVTDVFVDNSISALTEGKRPGFDALLAAISTNRYDVLLATEESRFARNMAEKQEVMLSCAAAGMTWETKRDGLVDPATDAGEFMGNLRATLDRFESRRKASRQRQANANAREAGRPTPGRRCYGYEVDGMTPRESEASVVRRMFEHVAAGGSLHALLLALKAEGIRPSGNAKKRNKRTGNLEAAPAPEWNMRRLRDTLLNPRYVGDLQHDGEVYTSEFVVPLVDRETADAVRSILADPSRRTSPGPKPRHLLSGLMFCGECGSRMNGQRDFYRCALAGARGHAHILKARVEPIVREALAQAFLTGGPSLLSGEDGTDLAGLAVKLAEVEQKLQDFADGIRERLFRLADVRADLAALNGERDDLEHRIEVARAEKGAAASLYAIVEGLVEVADQNGVAWSDLRARLLERFDALDLERRRDVIRALLYVQVDKPARRGAMDPARVRVQHLVATWLNPDAVDWTDALDHVDAA